MRLDIHNLVHVMVTIFSLNFSLIHYLHLKCCPGCSNVIAICSKIAGLRTSFRLSFIFSLIHWCVLILQKASRWYLCFIILPFIHKKDSSFTTISYRILVLVQPFAPQNHVTCNSLLVYSMDQLMFNADILHCNCTETEGWVGLSSSSSFWTVSPT